MTNHRCISDGLRRLRDWYRNTPQAWIKSPLARNEDGGALIEFTVMAPLFFLIVYGMIEWGSIFYLQNNMVNASREGARTAAGQMSTALTSTQVMTAANQTTCNWLAGSGQQFTIAFKDWCTGLNTGAQDVTVTVSVNAANASLVNYLGMFTGVTFSNSTTMRKELNCTAVGVTQSCTCNAAANPPSGC